MVNKKLKIGDIGHLSDLSQGQVAKVLGLHNSNQSIKRRLLDMGITTGVKITIKHIAPLGDPISISLRGYELCLRKNDMAEIDIEVIKS